MRIAARFFEEAEQPLLAATPEQITTYIAHTLTSRSRWTANNRLLALRSLYRYADNGDPTAGIPVKHEKVQPRRPFMDSELSDLLGAAYTIRDRALVQMLLGSGCRRSEIVRIDTEDVDWPRQRILIHGKGAKQRWVAPGATAMASMREYLEGRAGPAWLSAHGNRMPDNLLYKVVRRLGSRAGVVKAHPHRFRVTFAVRFLVRFGNIEALKEVLGHEDVKTTELYATYGYAAHALKMQDRLDLGGTIR